MPSASPLSGNLPFEIRPAMIHTLFGTHVVTVSATESMWNASLHPEEQCFVRYAVPKRRRDFTAGRACAREALQRFGIEDFPVRVGRAHEPLWPSGIVGSVSHCSGYCGVAVSRLEATLALGLDVDLAEPLTPRLRRIVCSKTELEWIDRHPRPSNSDWAKIIFSAKESVYKCYFSLTGRRLNFQQVEIRLVPAQRQFVADLLMDSSGREMGECTLHGRYAHSPTHIFTGTEIGSTNHGRKIQACND
jgi:4'-phosphopantetheinyl transferase EntD